MGERCVFTHGSGTPAKAVWQCVKERDKMKKRGLSCCCGVKQILGWIRSKHLHRVTHVNTHTHTHTSKDIFSTNREKNGKEDGLKRDTTERE